MVCDETGLYDDSTVRRSYAPIGEGASVAANGRARRRDTLMATLCEDGRKAPTFWIEHTTAVTRGGRVLRKAVKVLLKKINQLLNP